MSRISYALKPVLSAEQCESIVGDGIRILDEIGIECRHPGVQAIFRRQAGGRVQNERLHFAPGLCREQIAKIRQKAAPLRDPSREHTQKSGTQITAGACEKIKLTPVGPWTCINVLDMDTQQIRLATLNDMREAVKLAEALGIEGRKICAPMAPSDIPQHLQCLAMARESWKYSASTGAGIASGMREAEFLWELGQLARVTPPYCFIEFAISPLTFNADALDLVLKLQGREQIKAFAIDPGPIPTLGGTGPLLVKSVLAQSVAETLGGSIMVSMLTGGEQLPLCSGVTAIGADMRFGTVNFSSPESIMLLQMGFEVGSHITGVFGMGGAMRSIGKLPDAQSASEKTMCALVGALSGARHFCDLGQLSVDDTFSFEQMVIDMEILAGVERFANGFPFEDAADTLGIIRANLESRNFFADPATLENHRDYYWSPKIFERRMLGSWQQDGARTVEEKARALAREKIVSVNPRVDNATAGRMDALYKRAADSLS